jgi:hypothetical protein
MINYSDISFGKDEPEVIWIPSPLGAIMITKEGHYLCDDDGNVVGEVEKDYADHWFKKVTE